MGPCRSLRSLDFHLGGVGKPLKATPSVQRSDAISIGFNKVTLGIF